MTDQIIENQSYKQRRRETYRLFQKKRKQVTMEKEIEYFEKELNKALFTLGDVEEYLESERLDDVLDAYDKISNEIKDIDHTRDRVVKSLLEQETNLSEVRAWSNTAKKEIERFREFRMQLKQRIENLKGEETKQRLQREQTYQKDVTAVAAKPQSVKLQKYTITPFEGDYKDWIRFWNQFSVEVDGSSISEISKFNYLLELLKGKPRDDILGLPHTVDGYREAKKILEDTYGKDIKVRKAIIKGIKNLPEITSMKHVSTIHEFYNKLSRAVRTLSTMKKLESAESTVYTLMDKLGPVREIIAQKDDDWEEWGLEELVENLRKYVERNPLVESSGKSDHYKKGHEQNTKDRIHNGWKRENSMLSSSNENKKQTGCVYCGLRNHFSSDCQKVLDVASRREILKTKRLCFNCTKSGHGVSKCLSRGCRVCKSKHHTSLCDRTVSTLSPQQASKNKDEDSDDKSKSKKEQGKTEIEASTRLHAMTIAQINGLNVRIMIDNGSSSSYICTDLITHLGLKPKKTENKIIEQMYGIIRKKAEIYQVQLRSIMFPNFTLPINCTNAEKNILTYLPNQRIKDLKRKYPRISRLQFSDEDTIADELPIHIVLGVGDYQRIKTTEPPILGEDPTKDPGAELTKFGWVLSGNVIYHSNEVEKAFYLNSNKDEFEKLCSLEVIGITDSKDQTDETFIQDFTKQLTTTTDGRYKTRLPWKKDCVELPQNKDLALTRLKTTTRRLERIGRLDEYEAIIRDQIDQGMIEKVPPKPTGPVIHYVPHQAVIKDEAETTKLRVVYDCSARGRVTSPSLNDCLEVGPSLQPLLLDILLRNRMKKYCLIGDIKKAFLQIDVDEMDRDALRFFWYNDLQHRKVEEYRFTRVIFGSGPSPFILNATLQTHVKKYTEQFPKTCVQLLEDTYVDDIQLASDDQLELEKSKDEAALILGKGGFDLHKWHSNIPKLDGNNKNSNSENIEELTYSKQTVGTEEVETKILGTPWNKEEDNLSINFTHCIKKAEGKNVVTKRHMLSTINAIYDVLGLVSPVTLIGKSIFGEACLKKLTWDEEIPNDLLLQWSKWIEEPKRCTQISVPRCSVLQGEGRRLYIHGFSDASKVGVSAAIYILSKSGEHCEQNLLVSKSRISPKNQSTPRLELVGAYMLSKLINHVKETLHEVYIEELFAWTDSTTVLHWLQRKGTWSRYVRNRVNKILQYEFLKWKYVPSEDNPSDQGSRGVYPRQLKTLWLKGPNWLPERENWPTQPELVANDETKKEQVEVKEIAHLEAERHIEESTLDRLLQRPYWKMVRITAYIKRFIHNCRKNSEKQRRALTTDELLQAEKTCIKMIQIQLTDQDKETAVQDEENIWRKDSRIQGYKPIVLPRKNEFVNKLVTYYHEKTLHGGVNVTLCNLRQRFWITKLRALVKSVIHRCNKCKKYRAKPIDRPPTADLPNFRTELNRPFSVTGVDFAGPMLYKVRKNAYKKCYIAIFTCAAIRAVHLKLCPDLTADHFKHAMREFVARRGVPDIIISDNGKTFCATAKWLQELKYSDEICNYLADNRIQWRFNLSRAPWWGGFFERLIGIMKKALSKVIGKGMLRYNELEDILLDVECYMNNRPLVYQGEDFEEPVLTPNILLRGQPAEFLEEDIEKLADDSLVTKRINYLQNCKTQLRRRWTKEYLQSLEERQMKRTKERSNVPRIGSIVLIKDDVKDKGQWRIGRVTKLIKGTDEVIRGCELKLGNGYTIQRPLQLICDLEIVSEEKTEPKKVENNEIQQRTRYSRRAKDVARDGILAHQISDEING